VLERSLLLAKKCLFLPSKTNLRDRPRDRLRDLRLAEVLAVQCGVRQGRKPAAAEVFSEFRVEEDRAWGDDRLHDDE